MKTNKKKRKKHKALLTIFESLFHSSTNHGQGAKTATIKIRLGRKTKLKTHKIPVDQRRIKLNILGVSNSFPFKPIINAPPPPPPAAAKRAFEALNTNDPSPRCRRAAALAAAAKRSTGSVLPADATTLPVRLIPLPPPFAAAAAATSAARPHRRDRDRGHTGRHGERLVPRR